MDAAKSVEKFITKPNLKKLLGRVLRQSRLVAPAELCGDIVFKEVDSVSEIAFDYQNCLNAPKDYMLSNDELLFRYDLDQDKNIPRPRQSDKAGGDDKIVIFGSRPCDTRAVGLLDKFFSRKFEDPLYFRKRNRVMLITLACATPGKDCFCSSVSCGPYLRNGFDIQLTDIGRGYFLEAFSEKGKDFLSSSISSDLIAEAGADKRMSKEKRIKAAGESKHREFNLKKVYANLGRRNISQEFWKDLAQRCQSCGGCLLICPSCSCFYVTDKKINSREGARVRSLDACLYKGFSRISGGYNPVSTREAMMKRKFYHKLWQQLDEFSEPGCTGCGRCNRICPGNINWLEAIKKIAKYDIRDDK